MSQIDEIKSRIDIVDLIGETVKLRRSGRNYAGLCPFHNEKTPSFMVSPDRQTWRCFGQCNEGGDIFKFVMKKEGWDFKEALRHLAQRAGVTLQAYTPQQQEEKDAHERLRTLLEEAAAFYRHHLFQTEAGKPALSYLLEKRKLTPQTIEAFGLGYAPPGWDNALKHFTARGFTEQELTDAGLITSREKIDDGRRSPPEPRSFDRFRHRIMIPIRDEQGRMAGFGARILNPDDFPKFLNSPETPLFSKSRLLYGLDRARKAIRAADQAVIVEGYLDVMALHQAGFENVVSPMGTALTEEQLRLLKRFSRRIVLALDPDAAGQKAILSGLEAARQSLDRETELRFDARGLLRHEARLQADLRVAALPDALDPDEIVQRDPDQWKALIENARPIVIHVMETLAAGRDLEDAKVKSEIAAGVIPLIEDLPNAVERETYRQRLARFLKVDERALLGPQAPGLKARRPRLRVEEKAPATEAPIPVPAPQAAASRRIEAHILGILLRCPDLLFRLDRLLQEITLGRLRLTPDAFGHADHQMLFQLVRQSLEQDLSDPNRYILDHLPDSLAALAGELMEKAGPLDSGEERLLEDLSRAVLTLCRRNEDDQITQLRYLIAEDQAQEGMMTITYRQMVLEHIRARQMLDQAARSLHRRRK